MSGRDAEDRRSRRRIPIRRPNSEASSSQEQDGVESADDQLEDDNAVSARILEAFERELAAARRQRDAWEDKYRQAHAEMETMRSRLRRAAENEAFSEQRRTLASILEVADNLERAMAVAGETETELAQGVHLTYRELQRILRERGVKPIDALGKPFDPTYHEAVNVVERADVPEETVVKEEQKGYTYREQVLRPARVWVAK